MDKTFDPGEQGPAAAAAAIAGMEVQNMLTACHLIATAAQIREESRGAHYRLDFPERNQARWRKHLLWRRSAETPSEQPIE